MSQNFYPQLFNRRYYYYAWKKLKYGLNIELSKYAPFYIPIMLNGFDEKLEEHIEQTMDIFKALADGEEYKYNDIYILPYPKGKDKDNKLTYRQWCLLSIKDQYIWTVFTLVIGDYFEKMFPENSFGYRLNRTVWKEGNEWEKGNLSITNSILYEPYNRGFNRFRREPYKQINELLNENKTVYWLKFDLKKFYVSIKREKLKEVIEQYIDEDKIKNIFSSLLNFPKYNYMDIEEKEKTSMLGGFNESDGIPTGLIVAGFLQNFYMLRYDEDLNNESDSLKSNDIYIYRYVDDHIVLSSDLDKLIEWFKKYIVKLKEDSIEINKKKFRPNLNGKINEFKDDNDFIQLKNIINNSKNFIQSKDSESLKHFKTIITDKVSLMAKKPIISMLTFESREHKNKLLDLLNFEMDEEFIKSESIHSFVFSGLSQLNFSYDTEKQKDNAKIILKELKKILIKYPYKFSLYKSLVKFVIKNKIDDLKKEFEFLFNFDDSVMLYTYLLLILSLEYTNQRIKNEKYSGELKKLINFIIERLGNNENKWYYTYAKLTALINLNYMEKINNFSHIENSNLDNFFYKYLSNVITTIYFIKDNKFNKLIDKNEKLMFLALASLKYFRDDNKMNSFLKYIIKNFNNLPNENLYKVINSIALYLINENKLKVNLDKVYYILKDYNEKIIHSSWNINSNSIYYYNFVEQTPVILLKYIEHKFKNEKINEITGNSLKPFLSSITKNRIPLFLLNEKAIKNLKEYQIVIILLAIIKKIEELIKSSQIDNQKIQIALNPYNIIINKKIFNKLVMEKKDFLKKDFKRLVFDIKIEEGIIDSRFWGFKLLKERDFENYNEINVIFSLGVILYTLIKKEFISSPEKFKGSKKYSGKKFILSLLEENIGYSSTLIKILSGCINYSAYQKKIEQEENNESLYNFYFQNINELKKMLFKYFRWLKKYRISDKVIKEVLPIYFKDFYIISDTETQEDITLAENVNITIAQLNYSYYECSNNKKECSSEDLQYNFKQKKIKNNLKLEINDNIKKELIEDIETSIKKAEEDKTDILIFPELSIPKEILRKLYNRVNSSIKYELDIYDDNYEIPNKAKRKPYIIIGGGFYKISTKESKAFNQVYVISYINKMIKNKNISFYYPQDKFFPSGEEKEYFRKKLKKYSIALNQGNKVFLFKHPKFGNFILLICYDFLNLNVLHFFQGKVQHIIVVAYNKDIHTFKHLAETISRLHLANVIIVNNGIYGGSLAISPEKNIHKRERIEITGNEIFSVNTITLPVKKLKEYQESCINNSIDNDSKFKFSPQSFGYFQELSRIKIE